MSFFDVTGRHRAFRPVLFFFAVMFAVSLYFYCCRENASPQEVRNRYEVKLSGSDEKTVAASASFDEISGLYAGYAVLMDAKNGRVLFEKNGYKKVPMASTTKIMTLLVVLETANLEDTVTVSGYAASMPDVQLGIVKGEEYRLKDLVYSLMLESHNDSAVAIAEHVGKSVEGFAKMMNDKAEEIGAYDTHFVTPNGLDADGHCTTARDLALIASYAIQNKKFCEIINTRSYTFHEQRTGRVFTVNNKNQFLNLYEGAFGIKTGFTGKAGYCFAGAAKRKNKTFVSVVLACGWPPNKSYKWSDTKKLMDYGMNNYHKRKIVDSGIAFQKIPVTDAIELSEITPYVRDEVSLLLKDSEKVSFEVDVPKTLEAPVKRDKKLGTLTVRLEDEVYKVLPIYAKEGCRRITYSYVLRQIVGRYLCVG